jgi:hypothetical protein
MPYAVRIADQLVFVHNPNILSKKYFLGPGLTADYLNVIIVILETIAQTKELLERFAESVRCQFSIPKIVNNFRVYLRSR